MFFHHNIRDNDRNLCQDLLKTENTDSDLKVHVLHYANELLVRVRLSFQKLSLSIRVQNTINHFSISFSTTISTSKKNSLFQSARRARAEKGLGPSNF